jgi:hypothetical protein
MTTRNRLLAAGSTIALATGGLFFAAAPASAAPLAPECLAAQSELLTALGLAGVSPSAIAEINLALGNVVAAQAALDAVVNGHGAVVADLQAELELLKGERWLAVQAEADARANLGAALHAIATADHAVNLETGNLASAQEVEARWKAEVAAAVIDRDLKSAAVFEAQAAVDLAATTPDPDDDVAAAAAHAAAYSASVAADARWFALESELGKASQNVSDTQARLKAAIAAQKAVAAVDLDALRLAIDASVELSAELALEIDAVEGEIAAAGTLDPAVVAEATANLNAALAVLAELQILLNAPAADVVGLEALFDASLGACGVGVGGTAVTSIDLNLVVVPGTGGGQTVNRGLNVQTAAETTPAGGSDGLGFAGLLGLGAVAVVLGVRRRTRRTN